jgi:hypothetical protein
MATQIAARVRAVQAPLRAPTGATATITSYGCRQYSQYKKAAWVEAALVLNFR